MSQSIQRPSASPLRPGASPISPNRADQADGAQGLRRAVSMRDDALHIDHDVAPLLSELLARVDSILSPQPAHALATPRLSGAAPMPSPERLYRATHTARGKLTEAIQASQDDGSRQRLVGMLRVLDAQIEMKREIVFRVQDATNG